jgi:ABC-2 type transport system permease protein
MPQIQVENLTKIFRVPAKAPGLGGAVAQLFRPKMDFTRYPLNPYARAAQVFITWALPFAFVAYYPTLLLLDKMTPPPPLSYLSPRTGLAVTAAAARMWRRCLISCQGTGS